MNRHTFEKYCRKNPAQRLNLAGHSGAAVIPVCDEEAEFPATLQSLIYARNKRKIALIAVFNHPEGNLEAEKSNSRLCQALQRMALPGVFLLSAGALENGVGEARKQGLDCVMQSLDAEELHDFLCFFCDADSRVAPDYFSCLEALFQANPALAGAVPMLRHRMAPDAAQERAIRAYEKYCFDFQTNLAAAGSPYAYLTFGSAIVCRAESYAACGGMRVRKTGEDFYFLEALAKSSRFQVCQMPEVLVYPSPRLSHRVPVGTGTRVDELLQGIPLPAYPERAWAALKHLLASATESALADPTSFLASLSDTSRAFLEKRDFGSQWLKILANTPKGQFRNAFFCWFDALRTLQFLKAHR